MIDIDIEGFGRWAAFSRINNLHDLIERPLHREIFDQLGVKHSELHSLTCGAISLTANSVTIDSYLTEKVIKYKITGTLKVEAELIDDFQINEDVWKDLREKKLTHWMEWDGNIPFALVTKGRET